MNDLRSIAILDEPLLQPLKGTSGVIGSSFHDSIDGYDILAQDNGKGIISHIWMTWRVPDSLTSLKIWIDDSLVSQTTLNEFFTSSKWNYKSPLIYKTSGAAVCDLQIPYTKNFRITFKKRSDDLFFWGIIWRPVDAAASLNAFHPSHPPSSSQLKAEEVFRNPLKVWDNESARVELPFSKFLPPHDTVTIETIDGPGLLQSFTLLSGFGEQSVLDSIVILIHWDDCPIPSVNVPLTDFFCARVFIKEYVSLPLNVNYAIGPTSNIPMPFYKRATFKLVNISNRGVNYTGKIAYSKEPIDRKKYGYFRTDLNVSNPTRFGVFHPIMHRVGNGRYIGTTLQLPQIKHPVALEGDPIFLIDSLVDHKFRLTGTEDYFNGGFYYADGEYATPFSGCVFRTPTMYRFHYLDAFDFKSSFDLDIQHGADNDVKEEYRSVAFYYKHWTPFWTNRDSFVVGESITVSGTAYEPGESIVIVINDKEIGSIKADNIGAFSWTTILPSNLALGKCFISVNDEIRPEPLYIFASPQIRLLTDSERILLALADTLAVTGNGFNPTENLTFFLGSNKANAKYSIGEDHRFFSTVVIPKMSEGTYNLTVVGSISGEVLSTRPITVTHLRNYEFEELLPPFTATSTWGAEYLSYYWHTKFSKQAVANFFPQSLQDSITFRFHVPYLDSFRVVIFACQGTKFGNFSYSINGKPIGVFEAYKPLDFGDAVPSDSLEGGIWKLDSGNHYITFTYVGKNSNSTFNQLSADHLILIPLSQETLSIATTITTNLPKVYPNPANTIAQFGFSPDKPGEVRLDLIDVLGKTVLSKKTILNRFKLSRTNSKYKPASAWRLFLSNSNWR